MSRKTLIPAFAIVLLLAAAATWMLRPAEERSQSSAARELPSRNSPRAGNSEAISKSRWQILTRDDLPRHQRLEIARQISDTLGPEDASALFAALDHAPRPGSEEDWYVVLNEIMERMRRYGIGAESFSTRLGKLVADPARPEVVRDYAIQHLVLWTAPGNPDQVPHEQEPEIIARNLGLIAGSVSDPALSHTTVPGTALLALAEASRNLPVDVSASAWQSLDAYLTGLFSGEIPTQPSTRVSAIQAVALAGRRQYLPDIRALASSETTDPSVRLSSIASLGFFATADDRILLERIAARNDRYRFAASSALERLNAN